MTSKITRINQIAKQRPKEKFTSLYHLINQELLIESFCELDKKKVVGIDKIAKEQYRLNLHQNIKNLVIRLKNKSYKPTITRKNNMPKANNKLRSLALANLEDKIVELSLKKIIEAIYEPKFSRNMFGFRTSRNYLMALRKISTDIEKHFTNYIVEVNIKECLDNVNCDEISKYLDTHIKDPNIIRLIKKFLKAGILKDGHFIIVGDETISDSILSPVLANVYIYYTLIKWFEDFIKIKYNGYMSIINYAETFICCFQDKIMAKLFYEKLLPSRLKEANLELAICKTRLIEFSRCTEKNCNKGKNDTFEFLGFTHYCSNKNGQFRVKRKTSSKNLIKELTEMNNWCKKNNNLPLDDMLAKFKNRIDDHYNYYGITDNYHMIRKYYYRSIKILYKWLNRRSQRKSYTWKEFSLILKKKGIPKPYIRIKIYDNLRFDEKILCYEEPYAGKLHVRFCEGNIW